MVMLYGIAANLCKFLLYKQRTKALSLFQRQTQIFALFCHRALWDHQELVEKSGRRDQLDSPGLKVARGLRVHPDLPVPRGSPE